MELLPHFFIFKTDSNIMLSVCGDSFSPQFSIINKATNERHEGLQPKSVKRLVESRKISKSALEFIKNQTS